MNRLQANMESGTPSFGVLLKSSGPMIDHMAKAGVDYVIIDMMFSFIDWQDAYYLVRTCKASGVFPFIRIQSYPWVGDRPDPRLVVDAARAVSVGAQGVCVSVRSKEEVAEVAQVVGDWHRGIPITSATELKKHEEAMRQDTWIMPLLESRTSIEEYAEILDIPGVRAVWPGLTDLSEQLGHPYEYEHPDVWAWADKVVAKARPRGIAVCMNDGFIYTDIESKAKRLAQLREHGADMLHLQTTEFLAYLSAKNTIDRVRDLVPAGSAAPARTPVRS